VNHPVAWRGVVLLTFGLDEEEYLVEFFGQDYVHYKQSTGTGLPFIR